MFVCCREPAAGGAPRWDAALRAIDMVGQQHGGTSTGAHVNKASLVDSAVFLAVRGSEEK